MEQTSAEDLQAPGKIGDGRRREATMTPEGHDVWDPALLGPARDRLGGDAQDARGLRGADVDIVG